MSIEAPLQYSTTAKFFHWLVAVIVIAMLSGSFFLEDVPEAFQSNAYMLHKSFGLTVLFLMIIRFIWINYAGKPRQPLSMALWERVLSRVVQYSFYVFLVCMPLVGWIMSVAEGRTPSYFGLFNMPLPIHENKQLSDIMAEAHTVVAWILIVLLVLHILGALKHEYINKDDVLKRMLPGRKMNVNTRKK